MPQGFPYKDLTQLYKAVEGEAFQLPRPGKVETLKKPVHGEGFEMKNALVVQPMEGCDADENGAPTDWTIRRYRRFAAGGAALVWMEAVSVCPEGRANPHQLMITEANTEAFRALIGEIKQAALQAGVQPPLVVAQLTQSGRWSRPSGAPEPMRAWRSEVLDRHQNLPEDYPIVSDEYLSALPELYARSTRLCMEAGFDGVDIKACHLYLMSELLGAKGRPGPYGGCYENRVRLLLECVDAAREQIGQGILAARINLYDGEAASWGVGEGLKVDYEEPMRLVEALYEHGVRLLNLTMGTPYYNPHVNRPYATGGYETQECAVEGVARLLDGCRQAQARAPQAVCVATGLSYLRQFAPQVAAGLMEEGGARAVGFGREAFAYPDFARDILEKGEMTASKCCVTCGLCTRIMRAGGRPGCPVRDAEFYLPELRRVVK